MRSPELAGNTVRRGSRSEALREASHGVRDHGVVKVVARGDVLKKMVRSQNIP